MLGYSPFELLNRFIPCMGTLEKRHATPAASAASGCCRKTFVGSWRVRWGLWGIHGVRCDGQLMSYNYLKIWLQKRYELIFEKVVLFQKKSTMHQRISHIIWKNNVINNISVMLTKKITDIIQVNSTSWRIKLHKIFAYEGSGSHLSQLQSSFTWPAI